MTPLPLNKRALTYILTALGLLLLLFLSLTSSRHSSQPPSANISSTTTTNPPTIPGISTVPDSILKGSVIAGKIENATAKADLGRAAWKLFHTTMAKFPDTPSQEEQTALFSYIHLFARLYPCGECASHFRQILEKFPPQVSTRSSAAAWACHVHNEVNKSLGKELFDCSNIGDFYNCGCADEEGEKEKKGTDRIDLLVEKNGPTRGG